MKTLIFVTVYTHDTIVKRNAILHELNKIAFRLHLSLSLANAKLPENEILYETGYDESMSKVNAFTDRALELIIGIGFKIVEVNIPEGSAEVKIISGEEVEDY